MSSLRNAVQRRPHRERAQPRAREKYGILEKHKDYSLRARDFNVKKAKLKSLREKAASRNEDEFYFGMMSTKSVNGQKIGDRGNRAMPQREVVGLKRQDAAYLRTMLQVTRREIEKLEREIQLLEGGDEGAEIVALKGSGGKASHTVFADTDQQQKAFSAHEWFKTNEDGLERSFNRPRKPQEMEEDDSEGEAQAQGFSRKKMSAKEEATRQKKREEKRRAHGQEVRLRKLELLKTQEKELAAEEQELELQRAKMANTATSGVNKNGVKFKIRERKR